MLKSVDNVYMCKIFILLKSADLLNIKYYFISNVLNP